LVIKRVLTLILIFLSGINYAKNTILAIVDGDLITSYSIQKELNISDSYDVKISVIQNHIDTILQLKKARKLNLYPSKSTVNLALLDIANENNITINQLELYPKFFSLKKEITEKISLSNLKRFVVNDFEISSNKNKIFCSNESFQNDIKQIKIAQIFISELNDSLLNKEEQNTKIKSFLNQLAKHASKGASFEALAKLHSQHPSYYNGGITSWLSVDNPKMRMLDSLQVNMVSEVYSTKFGFAIAIKTDERFLSSQLIECIQKANYLDEEKFYKNWVKNLREVAYIKIYHDSLEQL